MTELESPPVLEHGAWVTRGLIVVWEAREPVLDGDIACPTCKAKRWQPCKTTRGNNMPAHKARAIPRCCPCGRPPWNKRAMYCEECRDASRRTGNAANNRRYRVISSADRPFRRSAIPNTLAVAKDERPQTADRDNGQTMVRGLTEPSSERRVG